MASPSVVPALAERADIHKSCKSVETLLNVLNDYCEAATAVVAFQKKLSKALKDTASLKVTGEIASNAMHASANIFESLSDIDTKFAKIADKEYDLVSTEVKKWFKKLAKEEKAHDERIANANARIKQAGQSYEKKSKKKSSDVGEEHARYINLISALGPEISQDKYNHTLNVSQRHTAITYSVAACLSRLADFEWQRSCECVRRFSPIIGPLGNWRSLCEGGWTGDIPPDLPDIEPTYDALLPQTELNSGINLIEEDARPQQSSVKVTLEPQETPQPTSYPLSTQSTNTVSPSEDFLDPQLDHRSVRSSPTLARPQVSVTNLNTITEPTPIAPSDKLVPPKVPFFDANTGSVRSLSAFPSPPTHFPLPPPRLQQSQQPSLSQSNHSSSNLEFPSSRQLAESPISANGDLPSSRDVEDSSARVTYRDAPRTSGSNQSSGPPSPEQRFREQRSIPEEAEPKDMLSNISTASEAYRPTPVRSQTSLPAESLYQNARHVSAGHRTVTSAEIRPLNARLYRDEYRETSSGKEFGVLNSNMTLPSKSRTMENYKSAKPIESMDTGASGSVVAAMRNRYSSTSGSSSPPPRDLPRLPLSVNDIAARYQPNDVPLSPRFRSGSPPVSRQQSLPLLDTAARQAQESHLQTSHSPQRNQTEIQRREKEQELKDRELELEMRARELERDRAHLQGILEVGQDPSRRGVYDGEESGSTQNGQFGMFPRERRVSLRHQLQRPLSQMELHDVDEHAVSNPSSLGSPSRSRPQHSYKNSANLAPPHGIDILTTQPLHSPKPSHPPSPLLQSEDLRYESRSSNIYEDTGSTSNTNSTGTSSHAPYCGCESCSVNKYKTSGQGQRPIESKPPSQRSEKSRIGGGWIRRLSMPVGNAFSLDSSKRHQSNNSIGSTNSIASYGPGKGIAGGPAASKGGLFSMDGKKNASTTALQPSGSGGGISAREDGKLARPGGGAIGRRSYDVSGVSNRSMTNLGVSGRH